MIEEDEKWMRRCIRIAVNGKAGAPPNPMVGAVIVHKGMIIGEGFHAHIGEGHAEVNAIASVKDENLLRDSTIYVSLEPCAHYGKTPPCSELIIKKGIPRVVVGCVDPFAKVHGKGIQMLRDAGVSVKVGVLERECLELNKHFVTFHSLHRPFITLKWAQSADGFIDRKRSGGSPTIISSPHTAMRAHRLRAEHKAILVGRKTALADNPSLTVRHWHGENPLRIVLDSNGVLPSSLRLFDGSVPTLIVGKKGFSGDARNTEVFTPDSGKDILVQLLDELHRRGIQSLLVEGGEKLLQSFIDASLWDEAQVEKADIVLEDGVRAPFIRCYSSFSVDTFAGTDFLHFRR